MVSIYDIVWQKCNFKGTGQNHLEKFTEEKAFLELKKEERQLQRKIDDTFSGFVFLDIASKYLCLQRGEIDIAYDSIFPQEDNTLYYEMAINKEKDIDLIDFCQIYFRYCNYGEVAHDEPWDEWYLPIIKTGKFGNYESMIRAYMYFLERFEEREGAHIGPKCKFDGAYNNIISCSYTDYLVHIMNDTLWVITSSFIGKRNMVTLLIAYVMGMKCEREKYCKIKRFGVYCIGRGTIHTAPIKRFSQSSFKSAAKTYVGYKDEGQKNWEDFEGTDVNVFREVVNYHKNILPPEIIKQYYVQEENIKAEEPVRLPYAIDDNYENDTALPVIANSLKNLPAFASGKNDGMFDFEIYYISDIHIEHHLSDKAQRSKAATINEIEEIAKGLVTKSLIKKLNDIENDQIFMFLGDTANSVALSKLFYEAFMTELRKYKDEVKVFAVIGNHELSEFDTLKKGIEEYKKLFKSLNISMLQNEYEVVHVGSFGTKSIAIAGGIGFAKYNDKFNSDTQVGAGDMNHKKDAKESEQLQKIHKEVLEEPSVYGRIVLFMSHYPLHDWMPEEDINSRCMYFNGHNHHNTSFKSENRSIYSDNQIGYNKKKIAFKKVKVGPYYNPYVNLEDGVYEIGVESYLQFYEYCSERLNGTYHIDQQLKKGGRFCMIKQYGYYGFFITQRDRVMICKGGRIARLQDSDDFQYYVDNFVKMVSSYINLLQPFRKAEEMVSEYLKSLGLSGRIHGCIIDLDFLNHIMINPVDGAVKVYNSPIFGIVKEYDGLGDILEDMANKAPALYSGALKKYNKNGKELPKVLKKKSDDYEEVDVSHESAYGVSRDIRNVERIFTSNILRDWDNYLLVYDYADKSISEKSN
jgi:predicted MPP superfamily phosphohydrolase